MPSGSKVRLDLFEGFSLGFRHEEKRKEPCPDRNGSVQSERGGFAQDLRERQKRQCYYQVGAPVGDRPDAHGPAPDLQRVNLRENQPKNRANSGAIKRVKRIGLSSCDLFKGP